MTVYKTILEVGVIKDTIGSTKIWPCKRKYLKRILIGLRNYLTQFWNLIAFISIVLSYIMIMLWIRFIADDFLNKFLDDPTDIGQYETLNGFSDLMLKYIVYRRVCSLNCIFIAVNMLHYLSYFARINQFFSTVI